MERAKDVDFVEKAQSLASQAQAMVMRAGTISKAQAGDDWGRLFREHMIKRPTNACCR